MICKCLRSSILCRIKYFHQPYVDVHTYHHVHFPLHHLRAAQLPRWCQCAYMCNVPSQCQAVWQRCSREANQDRPRQAQLAHNMHVRCICTLIFIEQITCVYNGVSAFWILCSSSFSVNMLAIISTAARSLVGILLVRKQHHL
ncbi:uncharacterized protein EDB91DRAFT_872180 [Suillus paluster]|uniref:uncharacterized protein n=1 Tax=Suillus paluster TaxID=48578 RepID=UPI001B87B34B|nr:uncharacterized protein EDB91DRAFT_872180 [Suillus paluster]KAG1748288.1 hypothetical protein EDB91DRAFT_872180 [Suillus paluster]